MQAKWIAPYLSRTQREFLIGNIDKPRIIVAENAEILTRESLRKKNLIYYLPRGVHHRPTHTLLTELGREVVCLILAEYAEALMRTNLLREQIAIAPQFFIESRKSETTPV